MSARLRERGRERAESRADDGSEKKKLEYFGGGTLEGKTADQVARGTERWGLGRYLSAGAAKTLAVACKYL